MNYEIKRQTYPFHLVDPSPWPFITPWCIFLVVLSLIGLLHLNTGEFVGFDFFYLGLILSLFCLYGWFKDVLTEAVYEGNHPVAVQRGHRYGMILFIASEVLFFFGFFWAFFHSILIPSVAIGGIWPPLGIETLNPFEVPFLNTMILLSSGISITWAHRALLAGKRKEMIWALSVTIGLGVIFTCFQALEYNTAPFNINDGIYGSVFYMATGFHGFHVLIGTIFLAVSLWRQVNAQFTRQHHFGFEAAAWYWHFVDVVWLFLFTSMYWWGS